MSSGAQRTRPIRPSHYDGMKTLALSLFAYYIAGARGSLISDVVVFGDSYSDNGDGFAKFAQFVLRTNSVSPKPYLLLKLSCPSFSYRTLKLTLENRIGPYQACLLVFGFLQTWPEEPYFKGRWSNGPMWIEEAAATLQVSLADYAAGGATTGSVPGREQIQAFAPCEVPYCVSIHTMQCSRFHLSVITGRACQIISLKITLQHISL